MNDMSNASAAKGTTVRALWDWITGGRRTRVATARRTLTASELRGVRTTLSEMVETIGGEASARRRVASLATLYLGLDDDGRRAFLLLLATEFGPDPAGIAGAVSGYVESTTPDERRRAEAALRAALASPRIRILKQFNLLHEGVKFLVDLRADLLRFVRQSPQLEALDAELFELLGGWFDIGNLELRRISLEFAGRAAGDGSSHTRRCTRSARGPICATGSTPTAAATPSSTRACRRSR